MIPKSRLSEGCLAAHRFGELDDQRVIRDQYLGTETDLEDL
jgi:hypothetical protein